jgi:thioredoxin reductase (NADPH)
MGSGNIETRNISHVFVMAGAIPNTNWLDVRVAFDARGFIKTGPDLSQDDKEDEDVRCNLFSP